MIQKDKELLLKDLSARLPYGVMCIYGKYNGQLKLVCPDGDYCILQNSPYAIGDIKPYLRPMSSMTEEEKRQYRELCDEDIRQLIYVQTVHPGLKYKTSCHRSIDWLNEHHFDYRGLIEKGLALEAPEGMYNINEK